MTLHSFVATRVQKRIRTGSSSPVVVETSGGLFVGKLRGAGQGLLALVAEIIVAELAESLGLPVPERALIELAREVPSDDRNDELAQLLQGSVGMNLGFRFLEGARDPHPQDLAALDEEFMARVLWLDGLTLNPDRTTQNPNILLWNKLPWLIDHGAALTFHHNWATVTEDSPKERSDYAGHIFEQRVSLLSQFDEPLAQLMTAEVLMRAIATVPDDFLTSNDPLVAPPRQRAAYQAFLWKRLKAPRPFVP